MFTFPFFQFFSSFSVENNKQISHAFLFNVRNHSTEAINAQRREAELNIILPRLNNSIANKKGMEYWFNYMPPTPNNIWGNKG